MANILHIDSERSWRGGQQQAAYLLKGLLEKGFKTAIICQPDSEFEQYCIKEKLPFYPIKMRGEIDITAAFKISSICKKENFDILHLHSAHAVATGLWTKLFFKKLKLIGVRRVSVKIKKNPFSKFKYKTKMISTHVCISENIKKTMISAGVSENKLIKIYSGIDLNKFSEINPPADFRKNSGIPDDHILIGTVAAISKEKDYPGLLNAAKTIIQNNKKVTFCAVGSGPDEEAVHLLAKKLNLGNRFIFTGFRKDVGNFFKSFDIFVLASYLEGLGTSLLDAQTCGLPVIGCDTGGVPEIINHNINGILTTPKDHTSLSDAIEQLVRNPEKRKKFGMAGRKSVEEFNIENTINKNIELYNKIT